jgi:hypothetical protein
MDEVPYLITKKSQGLNAGAGTSKHGNRLRKEEVMRDCHAALGLSGARSLVDTGLIIDYSARNAADLP